MYLIDTNIFLEVLLIQEKQEVCKSFLDANIDSLYISDFSLHSIGVILFRNDRTDIFHEFVSDVIPSVRIAALPKRAYEDLLKIKQDFGLDFDDTYQYKVAKEYGLEMVTMDRDFKKIKDNMSIRFL